jgi:hypothetical protein
VYKLSAGLHKLHQKKQQDFSTTQKMMAAKNVQLYFGVCVCLGICACVCMVDV